MSLVRTHIDINADLGEGMQVENEIIPFLSSCSIACGGHAGDTYSMMEALSIATKHHLKIGAHPSFPDKENFGRKVMSFSPNALMEGLNAQIQTFLSVLNKKGAKLHHIKPHGALYNLACTDYDTAVVIASLLKNYPQVYLYAPYNSKMAEVAVENKIPVHFESFIDRAYNTDGTLVSRRQNGAVLDSLESKINQLESLLYSDSVTSLQGSKVLKKTDTICLHGDHQDSIDTAKSVFRFLQDKNIHLNKKE